MIIKKDFGGAFGVLASDGSLGERQIRVIASTQSPDRDGDIVVSAGCQLQNYNKNPIVLASHDRDKPIGTARVFVKSDRVEAIITFAPAGSSPVADHWCALAKSGVISAVSIGFLPLKSEPIRGGGRKITKWELFELSLVSVPANAAALVVERSFFDRAKSGRVLSAANVGAITELGHRLDKANEAHRRAVDLLGKAERHRVAAARIASGVLANAGDNGEDVSDLDADADADYELAAAEARRKRIALVESRRRDLDELRDPERRERLQVVEAMKRRGEVMDAELRGMEIEHNPALARRLRLIRVKSRSR